MVEAIPGAQLRTLADHGHSPLLDHPELVAELALKQPGLSPAERPVASRASSTEE